MILVTNRKVIFFFVIKMKGYFETKDTQVLLTTENFQIKVCFVLFFLIVIQKLIFPFPCFCALTSASVHLPGKWEGQGLGLWPCAAAAVLARAGWAQPGFLPQDDIIPFSELIRASRAWHTGSSHLLADGFRNFDVLSKSELLLCVFLS